MLTNSWSRFFLSVAAPILTTGTAFAESAITGPSSSQSPYVVPTKPSGITESLLTVGDAVNFKADGVTPYRMVGIPDGLGAFDNNDGTFTVLMNHELGATVGVTRDHLFKGSFVSRWVIDKETHAVLHGEDLIKAAYSWDVAAASYIPLTSAIGRLCSADLPEVTAFHNPVTGLGYLGRIFMSGEETGANGRAFAHFLDGNSYELPRLGKFSWENSVAHPNTGDTTLVIGLDDSGGGQVYAYVGTKSISPDRVVAAGLGNGVLTGIKVQGVSLETDATAVAPGTPFTIASLGDVSAKSGAEIEADSNTLGISRFNRPEDGAWDPANPNDFYFVTTASFTGRSRLWRLRFVDAANPSLGGTVDVLLDGTTGPKMMDNMTVTNRGTVLIQEDVGNNVHLGKIWRYSIATGKLDIVAQHDPERFVPTAPSLLTLDEESSGIVPLDKILGAGWYLLDVQAHYNAGDAELVEGGQLLLMHLPPGQDK